MALILKIYKNGTIVTLLFHSCEKGMVEKLVIKNIYLFNWLIYFGVIKQEIFKLIGRRMKLFSIITRNQWCVFTGGDLGDISPPPQNLFFYSFHFSYFSFKFLNRKSVMDVIIFSIPSVRYQ
jgi:hypothetical protein